MFDIIVIAFLVRYTVKKAKELGYRGLKQGGITIIVCLGFELAGGFIGLFLLERAGFIIFAIAGLLAGAVISLAIINHTRPNPDPVVTGDIKQYNSTQNIDVRCPECSGVFNEKIVSGRFLKVRITCPHCNQIIDNTRLEKV